MKLSIPCLLDGMDDAVEKAYAGWPDRLYIVDAEGAPGTVMPFLYKKTPQGELSLDVHFPKDWKAEDRRPAIVFFFGGGWSNGTVRQFLPQAEYLAGRGLVAARANYRVKSRHNVSPDACVEDAKSAVRWLRAHAARLGVDPDRIVASGGSAGAHIAACAALTPGLEAEGEDRAVSSKPNLLVLFNPALLDPPFFADRGVSAEKARLIAPVEHLSKTTPPAVLFFGTQDKLLEGGRAYLTKSKAVGAHAELYTAEGAGHGFFNKSPWLESTLRQTDLFLSQHGYASGAPTLATPRPDAALKPSE
jgi:acetyl esterase